MKLGVVMDPISAINFKKDSSLSILLEAQSRDYELYYMEPASLFLRENGAKALMQSIVVKDENTCQISVFLYFSIRVFSKIYH